jgi:glutamyl-tRNA synthetase
VRCRYAPSPTGLLHLGNARTALLAYAQVRKEGGAFIMRVEDLDRQRSRKDFIEANLKELRWLGLDWAEGPDVGGEYGPYVQSERFEHYQEALLTLEAGGHLFPCHLSRKDLHEVASAPHGRVSPYGDVQRRRNASVREKKQAEGKTPSLRFRVKPGRLELYDGVLGSVTLDPEGDTGDFVVRRADGEWAYQLAVVVDDSAMKITHVLRGDDLLPSTGAQLLLYEALDKTPPAFAHVPLLLDTDGRRMAKRQGSLTLSALREAGVKPERVVGLLAYTLGIQAELGEMCVEDIVAGFDLNALSAQAFRLEPAHLEFLYR